MKTRSDTLQFHGFRMFSLKELQKATNNFSRSVRIGCDEYIGTLEDGTPVTIKEIPGDIWREIDSEQDMEIVSTISTLSKIKHKNVVEIIGCCVENGKRFLVYEFASRLSSVAGLLSHHRINWSERASICIGIARALEYLHHGSNYSPVLHYDIHIHKIVIDGNNIPKIVDFGLAQISDDHFLITGDRRHRGIQYCPDRLYTLKSEVYSFGKVLLHVISAKDLYMGNDNGLSLVRLVQEMQKNDRILEVVDPTMSNFPEDEVKRFINVALMCVHSDPDRRPSMSEALFMLSRRGDFSNKELRNPTMSVRSSFHDEVYSPFHGTNPRESEVAVASSGHLDLINPAYDRNQINSTSESEFMRVPSHLMADREIEMEVLSDADAWEAFSCQVQDVIKSPEIKPYAQAIYKQCYGSPVIIQAIGSALRAESRVEEWKRALDYLQSGDTVNINDQCFFRRHIKYCYDRLNARDVKTCFLYMALFQEGEIDISTLVECFISEGLLSGTTTALYKKGLDIVGHLTKASLLEADANGLKVKMHNVVKESALEILSSDVEGCRAFVRLPNSEKDGNQSFQESRCTFNFQFPTIHKYLTRAGAHLKESPSIQEWEQSSMIFLMDNELSSLPSKPNCSTLVALLLQRNSCLRMIPASFFDSMSNLKILNLSKTRIRTLPDSFCRLSSLLILLMRDCSRLLLIPPSIGLLGSLKVLDLQGTELTHLPDSVGDLTSLEQLSVSFYGSMNHSEYKRLPSKLVSDGILLNLSLRELGIFVYPGDRRWISNASSVTKEISKLKLSVIKFHFPKVEDLKYFVDESQSWKNHNLTTFSIVVGYDFKRIVSVVSDDAEDLFNEAQRRLRFANGENIPDAVVEVLTQATSFYLDHHLTISSLSQFGIHFDGIKICILSDCPELIEIVNIEEQERSIFPVLEYLSINSLWKLQRIWLGHILEGSLARLRCLSVHTCPKLRYVFTCSMLNTLSNLEELVIEDCVSLQFIVIGDDDVEEVMCGDAAFVSNKDGLPMLRSLKVLKLHYLPKIRGIWRGHWPRSLEYLSFYNCPQLRNLHMKANDDIHIKEIAADKAWWDTLFWNDLELSRRLHKHLTQIHIDDL